MNRRERVIANLKRRRNRIIEGKVNCIPSKFKRFSNDFIGIEQGCFYGITSFTKAGKSQFASDTFIFEPLLWCYNNPQKEAKLKVLYFPLEETEYRITERFMSWLLFKYTKGKVRVSPRDLKSTTSAVSEEVFELLEQEDIVKIIDYFEECVDIIEDQGNPTGIYKYCKKYAEEHGTVNYRDIEIKDELGMPKTVHAFDSYEQDNPNEYRLIVIDTINLIDTERGLTLKQSMDKLSEYLAKYLRNRYNFSPLIIQQQAMSGEDNEAFKLGKLMPSVAGLGESKILARDLNILLGIYSPFRNGIPTCEGYDITKLKDNFRVLQVIINRDGEMGGLCPLFFDGAVAHFSELPKPDSKEMLRVYEYCKTLRIPTTKSFIMITIKKAFNRLQKLI